VGRGSLVEIGKHGAKVLEAASAAELPYRGIEGRTEGMRSTFHFAVERWARQHRSCKEKMVGLWSRLDPLFWRSPLPIKRKAIARGADRAIALAG
jgi:hypothetical protein